MHLVAQIAEFCLVNKQRGHAIGQHLFALRHRVLTRCLARGRAVAVIACDLSGVARRGRRLNPVDVMLFAIISMRRAQRAGSVAPVGGETSASAISINPAVVVQ